MENEVEKLFYENVPNKAGKIGLKQLRVIFNKFGYKLSVKQLRVILYHYDETKSKDLDLLEFKKLINDVVEFSEWVTGEGVVDCSKRCVLEIILNKRTDCNCKNENKNNRKSDDRILYGDMLIVHNDNKREEELTVSDHMTNMFDGYCEQLQVLDIYDEVQQNGSHSFVNNYNGTATMKHPLMRAHTLPETEPNRIEYDGKSLFNRAFSTPKKHVTKEKQYNNNEVLKRSMTVPKRPPRVKKEKSSLIKRSSSLRKKYSQQHDENDKSLFNKSFTTKAAGFWAGSNLDMADSNPNFKLDSASKKDRQNMYGENASGLCTIPKQRSYFNRKSILRKTSTTSNNSNIISGRTENETLVRTYTLPRKTSLLRSSTMKVNGLTRRLSLTKLVSEDEGSNDSKTVSPATSFTSTKKNWYENNNNNNSSIEFHGTPKNEKKITPNRSSSMYAVNGLTKIFTRPKSDYNNSIYSSFGTAMREAGGLGDGNGPRTHSFIQTDEMFLRELRSKLEQQGL